jgi:Prokaryotic E2 family E
LPPDRAHLEREHLSFEEFDEAGFHCVVLRDFQVPVGYSIPHTNLLIRLPPGFPDAAPDMWWCDPPIRIAATGSYPVAAELIETYGGRPWQRFSRHFQPGQWRPGRSGLETYLAVIRRDLERTVGVGA